MAKITIIGAGDMGSALTVPLCDNGHEVRLVGMELDEEIIRNIREKGFHPRLKCKLPDKILKYSIEELDEAMNDTEIVVMAITSDALTTVFKKVISYLKESMIITIVSKGFEYNNDGKVDIFCNVLKELIPMGLSRTINFAAVGGPCKANEVALRSLTYATYASENREVSKLLKKTFQTNFYKVEISEDVIGTEVCSAIKNAYSIALGMCDGLGIKESKPYNNLRSAIFYLAIKEMMILIKSLGGTYKSVLGLPGLGDLEVTGSAGRNKLFGERIGYGLSCGEALDEMKKDNITVEGYHAVRFTYSICNKLEKNSKISLEDISLITGLYKILYEICEPYEVLSNLLY